MEVQTTRQTSKSLDYNQSGNGAIKLVSKLLTETMAGYNERVAVQVEAENLFYDPKTKIPTTGSIRVQINNVELTESGTSTEISMTGVVETQGSVQCHYSLYFLMKRTVAVIPKSVTRMGQLLRTAFVMGLEKPSENLYDSLFNLSLSRIENSGKQYIFGEGRGFLVFGNGEAFIEH